MKWPLRVRYKCLVKREVTWMASYIIYGSVFRVNAYLYAEYNE